MLESFGIRLFTRERTLSQYVVWSLEAGLIELLAKRRAVRLGEATAETTLTESGADSLLGVLCALGLVSRAVDGCYSLTDAGRAYLLSDSPFFIADQIEAVGPAIPPPYLKQRASFLTRMKLKMAFSRPIFRFGSRTRIANQHARNLVACATAVRTGEFSEVGCLVDLAGGSGVFAIPLALEYPDKRIVLTELPEALPNVQPLLVEHGVEGRVELLGLDALRFPWRIPECDGIFIGNFLHGFDDETCRRVCRESFERLGRGGKLWIHEMIWNECRDGPLMTALWHAAMRSAGPGGQRTGRELSAFLESAGFSQTRIVPTAGAYALICGLKA